MWDHNFFLCSFFFFKHRYVFQKEFCTKLVWHSEKSGNMMYMHLMRSKCFTIIVLKHQWLLLQTDLSRGDEVALRGASKRQLLLGNHHHLRAGWVDVSGSDSSWSTTRLYPCSTSGHGWSVLIVTLKKYIYRREKEGKMMNASLKAHTCWPECNFGDSTMVVLRHMVAFWLFACVRSHMPLAMCTASSVLQSHRAQNHSERLISSLCYTDVNSSEEGWGQWRRGKTITCNALYPPFSRTTRAESKRGSEIKVKMGTSDNVESWDYKVQEGRIWRTAANISLSKGGSSYIHGFTCI